MKKSEEDRLKRAIYESTLSTADAVPLPRWGRQKGGGSAAKKEANPASLRSAAPSKGRGSRGHSPYRHFERKREIFFVLGQAKDVRIAVFPHQSLPLKGNAIKLSSRTFLAPHRGSCPKG